MEAGDGVSANVPGWLSAMAWCVASLAMPGCADDPQDWDDSDATDSTDTDTEPPVTLALSAPEPGEPDRPNDMTITGADPGAAITVWTGTSPGTTPAGACSVDIAAATELASVVADATGSATFTTDVPAVAGATTDHLQAVATDSCVLSPVVTHTWSVREWVGTWNPEVADQLFEGGEPGAVFGSRVSVGGDGDGSGIPDLAVGAPHAGEPPDDVGRGAVFVWYDPQPGDHVSGVDHDLRLIGEVGSWAGWGLQWIGDVDLDGDTDLMVGAPWDSTNGTQAGVAYLVLMPRTGDVDVLTAADATLFGTDVGGHAGGQLFPGDDADGDGLPDLWIGAFEENGGSGVLYLVSSAVRGTADLPDVALAIVGGEAPDDRVGTSLVTPGDLDADGTPDLLIGASGNDRGGLDVGAVFLLPRPVGGIVPLDDANAVILGDVPGDRAGSTIATLGDLDGDGLEDFAIHAEGDSEGYYFSGAVSIATPPTTGEVRLADITRLKLLGEGTDDAAGAHVAACDIDGDGMDDLLVSAQRSAAEEGLYNAGRVHVFYGPLPTGSVTLSSSAATFVGAEDRSRVGQDVGCLDLDSNGLDDMVIGAEAEDTITGGNTAGSVYVLEGRARLP